MHLDRFLTSKLPLALLAAGLCSSTVFSQSMNGSSYSPSPAQPFTRAQEMQTQGTPGAAVPAGTPGAAVPAGTPAAAAPIVQQADGTLERPLPVPFVLSAEEQAQTDAILNRWEKFSTAIKTFETNFRRLKYTRSLDSSQPVALEEKGEIRYEAPDHGMFSVQTKEGAPSEKWICDGEFIYEYKYAQKQIDKYTLPPEMRGKAITQGPLPFLFGASAEELKSRYYIRHVQPAANLARPGQYWLEAYPKKSVDASEFQRAEIILSFADEVRPMAIKLHKSNEDQHIYIFDLKGMKVNKTKLLPSAWEPTVPDKMRMKVVPVE
ncbi:MAG: hypothetical protein E7029_05500 [Planctomycetaceae bacterium]|nr:hypothetical protein [Planctomycetaceae bacterium]